MKINYYKFFEVHLPRDRPLVLTRITLTHYSSKQLTLHLKTRENNQLKVSKSFLVHDKNYLVFLLKVLNSLV